ncbi:TonB-dependent receptor [Aestuariibacter sp. A3R04]|uniref:TonB-dependent receptor n=1 Tax=Aestuariibacter sp. A3R04 TaxID=2841571 RepID=UPI001C091E3A|nr:TonB-dependent receptor [Aestuariibacter sp. A3R04]MBU3023468.1 TonB-dependent receptor [Aestuariibacter sp. A3R04]
MRQKYLAVAVCCALQVPTVAAETISGTVLDDKGVPVTGAVLRVEQSSTRVKTNESGEFSINSVKPGTYSVHVMAPGFGHLHQDIVVDDGRHFTVDFVLTPSSIEVIDILATPIHLSVMESASPVSVLSGETLRRQQAGTLGDSLEKLPGVQSNFHGNVASTPIIRGLSGPRVLVTQNGLDVSDVSRVGPDHAVASEASTSQQIEVLRGPATLFFGSGAIGGVVNVVDGRVPSDNTTRGEWTLEADSVNDQKLAAVNATTGAGNLGFYIDGYWRETDDYDTPVAPDNDEEGQNAPHVVKNSASDSNGITLGTSYISDNGYVGIALERFNREYGIPGHSHGGEEAEEEVYADLSQTKVQILGEYSFNHTLLQRVQFKAGHTSYEHAEIEQDVTGTLFENDTDELRVSLMHQPLAGWNGGVSLHYKTSDVAAVGEEAFTPPSTADMFAIGIMEEQRFGNVLVQLGARVERVTLDAANTLLPAIAAHDHDEEDDDDHDHDHDHDDEHSDETTVTRVFDVSQEFTPVSFSAGVVWDFTEGYNVGLSVSRAQRAPSASELLSFGPHIGTRTYEVGALFALTGDEESALGLSQQAVDLETSNNIDLTLRKTTGDIGFVLNAFYNQVDNYYFQSETGLFAESGHDHDHGDEHDHDAEDEHDHDSELPVYLFSSHDAVLHGFEAQAAWQVNAEFNAQFFADYVRAKLKDGGDLPRTPPLRTGLQLNYQTESISAHIDVTRYHKQDDIAEYETETNGYTLVDAFVSYDLNVLSQDVSVYLKGTNLTDTEARVHSSFLKDLAPRPGRSIGVGLRGYF